MKAVILAAGKGTRMRELTNELPKPMLRVQGKPILEHIVAGVVAAGVREIFIVTGWRADVIENHFGDGKKFGAQISFGRQLVQDGTGKAPELAKDFIGDSPFLLTYGDILVPPETYPQMIRRFGEGDFAGVITVTPGEDVTKGGLNFFDEQFCLKRLVEKPSPEQLEQLRRDGWLKPGVPAWYNAGIYIFRPAIFEFTSRLQKSPRGEYELTDAISALDRRRTKTGRPGNPRPLGGRARSRNVGEAGSGNLTEVDGKYGELILFALRFPSFTPDKILRNKFRLEHRAEVVLPQQFAKFRDAALFVLGEVEMDVPLEIIAPEILVVFLAGFDDVVQRLHAEFFRVAQFLAQFLVFDAAPQRPDRINKWQIRHLVPGKAQVENFVRVRRALKINRPVADEQDKIFFRRRFIIFQRHEFGK